MADKNVNLKKEWTIMVYLAGDNDLSEDMALKLMEISEIFDTAKNSSKTKNISLLAYLDGNNPLLLTQLFNFTKGRAKQPIPSGLQIQNAAQKITIRNFVDWCVNTQSAKADNYALIVSGHGDGFQQTAFLRDETSLDYMTVKSLKVVLEEINQKILRDKLKILAFDSCVMSMIEVANEIKEVADIMVGAEGYMPTNGMSYKRFIDGLVALDAKLPIKKEDIARLLVQSAVDGNKQHSELTRRSLDASVFDLTGKTFDLAVESINNLGKMLAAAVPQISTAEFTSLVKEPLKKAILSSHWKCQSYLFEQSIDIIDFCDVLKAECFGVMNEMNSILKILGVDILTIILSPNELVADINISEKISEEDQKKYESILAALHIMKNISNACADVIEKVKACRIKSCFSGPDYQFSTGLALFFPWTLSTFNMTKPRFIEFSFACRDEKKGILNPWYSFLERYLVETFRPSDSSMRANKQTMLDLQFTSDKTMFAAAGDVLLDPPPSGLLVSENQYKEYFMRIKNFPMDNANGCGK